MARPDRCQPYHHRQHPTWLVRLHLAGRPWLLRRSVAAGGGAMVECAQAPDAEARWLAQRVFAVRCSPQLLMLAGHALSGPTAAVWHAGQLMGEWVLTESASAAMRGAGGGRGALRHHAVAAPSWLQRNGWAAVATSSRACPGRRTGSRHAPQLLH